MACVSAGSVGRFQITARTYSHLITILVPSLALWRCWSRTGALESRLFHTGIRACISLVRHMKNRDISLYMLLRWFDGTLACFTRELPCFPFFMCGRMYRPSESDGSNQSQHLLSRARNTYYGEHAIVPGSNCQNAGLSSELLLCNSLHSCLLYTSDAADE